MDQTLKQDITIGENLKTLRKKNKYSQEQVAAQLQVLGIPVTREILSRMERGVYSIRISALLAMKEIYKVSSFDEFFQGAKLKKF